MFHGATATGSCRVGGDLVAGRFDDGAETVVDVRRVRTAPAPLV